MNTKKIIASALIIAAGYVIGIFYAENKKRSLDELSAVLRLLAHMRLKISYSRTVIYEIFKSFEDKSLENCGFMACFTDFERESAGNAWRRACETLSVNPRVKNELAAFGDSLGLLDADNQLARLEICEKALGSEKAEIEKYFSKRQKSYRSLGALAGAMLAIILY